MQASMIHLTPVMIQVHNIHLILEAEAIHGSPAMIQASMIRLTPVMIQVLNIHGSPVMTQASMIHLTPVMIQVLSIHLILVAEAIHCFPAVFVFFIKTISSNEEINKSSLLF